MQIQEALRAFFGYDEFRPFQAEIIDAVMEGRDVLGMLPTGAGKSLCYQLPSLLLPRPTLVVSPLIALMKDQLDGLPPEVYPKATLVNSSVEAEEVERRLAGIAAGRYQLIYAAPERLRQQRFLRLLQHGGLSLVVVDEAHCVSVWGHDFRPDYLFIRKALDALAAAGQRPTLLALTATATPDMRQEIAEQLGRPLQAIVAPTYRPNLRLEVFRCANADEKMRRLSAICRETPGSAIVYSNSRERCEKLAVLLRQSDISAAHYHAGLERQERQETQERFMLGQVRVMVATVAFGMGVDKANVRLVLHFSLPESLEAYTQEAGRAGRDGKPARCVLLFAPGDKANLSRWLKQEEVKLERVRDVYRAVQAELGGGSGAVAPEGLKQRAFGDTAAYSGADTHLRVAISLLERCGLLARHPDAGRDLVLEMRSPPPGARAELESLLAARRRHAENRLAEIVAYAEGSHCRHADIALHFGQELAPCGDACDRCLGGPAPPPLPAPAAAPPVPDVGRAILKTVQALPFGLGRTGLVKTLVGAVDSAVKPERCALHGCLAGVPPTAVGRFVDRLVELGLLSRRTDDEYRRLSVTGAGQARLDADGAIIPNAGAPGRTPRPDPSATLRSTHQEAPLTQDEDDRFERLRAWRRIEAERAGVPPFVVFHDSVLRALARAHPATPTDLQAIPGIGPRKAETYGAEVLRLLQPEA